jgi:hypothetical protein
MKVYVYFDSNFDIYDFNTKDETGMSDCTIEVQEEKLKEWEEIKRKYEGIKVEIGKYIDNKIKKEE